MPPDIRTGLPALAGGASAAGTTGQGPPGSDPLAALFAAMLAQSGGTPLSASPSLPKLRASVKTNALSQNESAPVKPTTVKTDQETTAAKTQTSTPLPILPPPLLPIQMRPITPPTAGVTVGQKTMDTLPVMAVLPKGATGAKPDGELPLQGAGSDSSGASAKFPAFLIAVPVLQGATSAPASPVTSVVALPRVFDRTGTNSPLSATAATIAVATPALAGPNLNPSALEQSQLALSRVPAAVLPSASAVSAEVTVQPTMPTTAASGQPVSDTGSGTSQSRVVSPSGIFSPLVTAAVSSPPVTAAVSSPPVTAAVSSPPVTAAVSSPPVTAAVSYEPFLQGLSVSADALQAASQPSSQGQLPAVSSSAAILVDFNPIAAEKTVAEGAGETLKGQGQAVAGAKPKSIPIATASSLRDQSGKTTPQLTSLQNVGAAKDGDNARDGQPAREGLTAMEGAREGNAAMEGRFATDWKGTKDGTATEGAQAKEGVLSTAGASSGAPDQTGPLSAKAFLPAPTTAIPEKSLKSGAASANNNTRIDTAGVQTMPAKALPAELSLQVVGKRSERSVTSEAESGAVTLPAVTAPALAETAKAESKPVTPAERAEMVRQVTEGVGAMRLSAKPNAPAQMTLQLHPKDWGQLQVSVKVAPSTHVNAVQTVTAHIVAETSQVKAALERNSGELRQALRTSGLHLDRITVTVQSVATGAQAGTASGGSHHGMSGGGFGQTSTDQKTEIPGNASAGTPSFSAFTGSHSGRQGSQTPSAYFTAPQAAEPEGEEGGASDVPRRLVIGQLDTRA